MSVEFGALDIRAAGDRAILLVPSADDLDAAVAALRGAELGGMQDFLPAARTILITLHPGVDRASFEQALRRLLSGRHPLQRTTAATAAQEVVVPVRYDGADLADVAGMLGISIEALIERHTSRVWRCRFIGFTAGFGYLESPGAQLTVPRRAQSRTAVPSGSVALADGYCAVYPRATPGGWQLIGATDLSMWDPNRERPALLSTGTPVRFVAVDRP